METVSIFIYNFLILSALLSFPFIRKSRGKTRKGAKLPPGSMGWPWLGETIQLYSQDPNVFFATKQERYGEIFKTHILGCPCIMLASPEAARFVLVSQAHLFKPTYPKSKEEMIGPSALFFHQGDYHTRLRKLVQSSLSLEAIQKLIPHIEAIAVSAIESWAGGHVVNNYQEMKKFSFNVGILFIFGHLDSNIKEELEKNYCKVNKGYNSFPTNIPGTAYSKAIVARKRISKILSEIISKRMEKSVAEKDLLGHLLNYKDEKGQTLTEEQIADNIIGALFAAQDTTASALTWILKYLHDDQKLLELVKAEQKAICESNNRGKNPLRWAQIRNMPLTNKVILESLRMASIISFTFREAVTDVMPLFRNIHHSSEYFPDPQNFDPSRFEVAPKPNTFLPFGNGVHACPGNELAKLEMLIMIHHVVTMLRYEVVGSQNGIQYGPFPVPQHGLPVKFWKESSN
ncbi:Cytochrome P450 [Dillenia turbinata]|uniref:(+)-abscisic acid 8'-hydroxylase n=1 Tax=Dillenia turbinata TaxID=194707 RepID=A0AAN8ZTC5_9MAGN